MLLLFSFLNPLKKIEKFETEEELTIDKYYYTALILYIIVLLIVAFGAAKLSYTYNNFIGTSGGLKIFYAVIAFLLSEFYYPYYAYFVDPLPTIRRRV
jgi:hypothetical protein